MSNQRKFLRLRLFNDNSFLDIFSKGLCKLGALGGSDCSAQSLAEGSTVVLAKACRRLLLGTKKDAKSEETMDMNGNRDPVDFARVGPMSSSNSTRWAIDGLAFLSLSGEVKEVIVNDAPLLASIFNVAQVSWDLVINCTIFHVRFLSSIYYEDRNHFTILPFPLP